MLSGRWDHTVDYRSAIALASCYPRHYLFLAEDDHELFKMNRSGDYTRLIRAFLTSGLSSPEMRAALDTARPLRWNEL